MTRLILGVDKEEEEETPTTMKLISGVDLQTIFS